MQMRRLTNSSRPLAWLFLNFKHVRMLPKFARQTEDDLLIEPLSKKDINTIENLFFSLNQGKKLGFVKHCLLWGFGSRCCFLVKNSNNRIIGFSIYYLNTDDICRNTIHEGFIGVVAEFRNQGIATKMRRYAFNHFAQTPCAGISSRISVSNKSSLKSAEKFRFRVENRYFDEQEKTERIYLIYELDRKNNC